MANLRANYNPPIAFSDRPRRKKSQPGAVHDRNRAGAKLFKRFYRRHHGHKPNAEVMVRAGFMPVPKIKESLIGKIQNAIKAKGMKVPSRAEIIGHLRNMMLRGQSEVSIPLEGETATIDPKSVVV